MSKVAPEHDIVFGELFFQLINRNGKSNLIYEETLTA
jgi:hypothetical protein